MTTHIKYDVNKLVRENAGRMKKICYISSKIRDFRALSQLPDSTLFQQILSPPTCSQEQVMSNDGVSRSELVADTYVRLNSDELVYSIRVHLNFLCLLKKKFLLIQKLLFSGKVESGSAIGCSSHFPSCIERTRSGHDAFARTTWHRKNQDHCRTHYAANNRLPVE